jgi:hypothetical protein
MKLKPKSLRRLVKATPEELKFISENMKLAGFSGKITAATRDHETDMEAIAKSAKEFGAQVPCGPRVEKLEKRVRTALAEPAEASSPKQFNKTMAAIADEPLSLPGRTPAARKRLRAIQQLGAQVRSGKIKRLAGETIAECMLRVLSKQAHK